MRSRATVFVLAALLVLGLSARSDAQQRGRLIVENRSGSDVEVYVWRYNGVHWQWTFVAKVSSGYGVPIADVQDHERFRATVLARNEYRYHTVSLSGGGDGPPEDRWPIT